MKGLNRFPKKVLRPLKEKGLKPKRLKKRRSGKSTKEDKEHQQAVTESMPSKPQPSSFEVKSKSKGEVSDEPTE